MARSVLVAGATSTIAREVQKLLARDGDALFLVARDAVRLGVVADDLRIRGARRVETLVADLDDAGSHEAILDRAEHALGGLDTLLVAFGTLGDEARAQRDPIAAERIFRTNFLSAASLLTRAAQRFEQRGRGTIAAISSVAGDRGRPSNYVYGAAKGALSLFLEGLRVRLTGSGVRVVTVKPGLVDTAMTAHMRKNPLFASAPRVARGIHRSLQGGRAVVYVPGFWRFVMWGIRAIPEPLFRRLRL